MKLDIKLETPVSCLNAGFRRFERSVLRLTSRSKPILKGLGAQPETLSPCDAPPAPNPQNRAKSGLTNKNPPCAQIGHLPYDRPFSVGPIRDLPALSGVFRLLTIRVSNHSCCRSPIKFAQFDSQTCHKRIFLSRYSGFARIDHRAGLYGLPPIRAFEAGLKPC